MENYRLAIFDEISCTKVQEGLWPKLCFARWNRCYYCTLDNVVLSLLLHLSLSVLHILLIFNYYYYYYGELTHNYIHVHNWHSMLYQFITNKLR